MFFGCDIIPKSQIQFKQSITFSCNRGNGIVWFPVCICIDEGLFISIASPASENVICQFDQTFMPKWGNINERRNQLHEVIRLSGMNLIIDDTDHPLIIKVASIQSARMQVYFIDNDDYFQNRLQVTDENGEEYEDNDARAIFYARGVLETVKKLRWCPDIIHCHGWMTALAPLYIKKAYKDEPSFRDAKVIFSLYEDDFKQPFHADFSNKLLLKGIGKKDIAGLKEPIDYTALCKLAADFSDGIIQQSEHVNEEVLNYARESGKPVLEYQSPENFAEACNDFYDKVWETEQK